MKVSKARATIEKRSNALAQTVSPRVNSRQSFEKCVITPFAIFAAFALIRTETPFVNVDLSFPASRKNDSMRKLTISRVGNLHQSIG
jgi:hypothetical protein